MRPSGRRGGPGAGNAVQGRVAACTADGHSRTFGNRTGLPCHQFILGTEAGRIVERIQGNRHRHLGPRTQLIGCRRDIDPGTINRDQLETVTVVLAAIVLVNQFASGQIAGADRSYPGSYSNTVQFQGAMRDIAGNQETEILVNCVANLIIRGRVIGIRQRNVAGGQRKTSAFDKELGGCRRRRRIILRRDAQVERLQRTHGLAIGNRVVKTVDEVFASGMGKADLAVDHVLLRESLVDQQRSTVQGDTAAAGQGMQTVNQLIRGIIRISC